MEATKAWSGTLRRRLAILRTGVFNLGAKNQIKAQLRERFAVYRCENLHGIPREDFRRQILDRLGTVDGSSEGYNDAELDRQRDLSVKFHWGHNHDFGDFQLTGRMADRHLDLMADFIDFFPLHLQNFEGKTVLDVGCWTGGTALLLCALGSNVVAIEEVKKYADTAAFLARSFGLADRMAIEPLSLYSCNNAAFADRFDIVHFPGVIYHLSDPVVGLRILYNALKPGGTILVESAGIHHEEPYCRFDGSLIVESGNKQDLSRVGWNWFLPSPSALFRMMREAGFEKIETRWNDQTRRVYGFGRKLRQVGICKAGLSVPDIR
jgi:SAM-dependent methyltransferase